MADKQYMFPAGRSGIPVIILLYLSEPVKIMILPLAVLTLEGTSGTTAGKIKIVGKVGDLVFQSHFEFIPGKIEVMGLSILFQEIPQTAHSLVGLAFIEIQDRHTYFPVLVHDCKLKELRIPFYQLIEIGFKAVPDRNDLFADIDLIACNRVYVAYGYDERTMDPDKFVGWKLVGKGF
jgi:hypothetical protein